MKKGTFWMLAGILTDSLAICSFIIAISSFRHPKLTLQCDEIEVKKGETVDAGLYLKTVESRGGKLILPEINTETAGRFAAVYRLEDSRYLAEEILYVTVKQE